MMDLEMLKSLMGKKGSEMPEMDSSYKDAKMSVLKDLHSHMGKMLGGELGEGMKKVTVAAPSEEGLEMGLEKAKDVVKEMPEMEEMEGAEESDDEMSADEIEAKIAELQAKKAKMMKV